MVRTLPKAERATMTLSARAAAAPKTLLKKKEATVTPLLPTSAGVAAAKYATFARMYKTAQIPVLLVKAVRMKDLGQRACRYNCGHGGRMAEMYLPRPRGPAIFNVLTGLRTSLSTYEAFDHLGQVISNWCGRTKSHAHPV